MEFRTPTKLFYDTSPRGTIFVRWRAEHTLNINGITELKPVILEIIDIPMIDYNVKIEIKSFNFKNAVAFYLDDSCYYNSKKNTLTLIFKTEPF